MHREHTTDKKNKYINGAKQTQGTTKNVIPC